MQPIQLKLEYFGPYENSTIDFSNYYAQSLFLITGKTGAGKTTIFDGMSYALYGSTSGGLRKGKEMRSNFAPSNQKTKVTFTFKQDGFTYRIERVPEQTVKKQRGDGYRESKASVILTVFDANQEEVNQLTKQKEVGIFLNQLIQLNQQQFSQIVMLPQGEFRRFLIADSDAKEKVLRKLFDTYFYQDITESLRQKKKIQETALKDIQSELTLLVSQLDWSTAVVEADLSTLYYQDVLALYKKQESLYQKELQNIQTEVDKLAIEQKTYQEKFQNEKNYLNYFEEQQIVLNELAEMAQTAQMIDTLKQQVETLQKVQKIVPTFNRIKELKKEQETSKSQQEKLLKNQMITKKEVELVSIELAHLLTQESSMNENQKELERLESLMPLVEKKKEIESNITKTDNQLKKMKQLQKEKEAQQKRVQTNIHTCESLIQTEPELTGLKYDFEKKITDLDQQLQDVKEISKQETRVFETQQTVDQLTANLTVCREDWQQKIVVTKQVKSDWAKSQIARLSLELLENEPCPVCGSTDHPDIFCQKEWSSLDLKELDHLLEKSEKQEAQARDAVTTLESQVDFKKKEQLALTDTLTASIKQMSAQFEKHSTINEWLENIQQSKQIVEEKWKLILKQLDELSKEKERLLALKKEDERLEKQIKQEEIELRKLEDYQLQLITTSKELQKNLPNKWVNLDDILKEQDRLTSLLSDWTKNKQNLTEKKTMYHEQLLVIETTLSNEATKEKELLEKLTYNTTQLEAFLVTNKWQINQLEDILINLTQLDEWTNQIKEYEKKEYALKAQAQKLEKKLSGRNKPNLEPLEEKMKELEQLIEAKKTQLTTVDYQIKSNQKIVDNVIAKETSMKVALEELEELIQLADVLTGDGPNKLSLERFILQTYLKRILQRANQKLTTLTNSRYQFELNQEIGSFKKKTGLEINIYDDNAGAIRGVNTLSGGESFIAALSLALSLAEVIQEESGGIKIDAMFIDEGFGSLDEDALEMAIRALEGIQGKGRLIGIISHVRELKERIPQQLQIKTTTDGKSYVKERLEFE